jgi:hypothetical protein
MLQVLASWTLLKAEKRSIDLESCVVLQSTFAAVRREKKVGEFVVQKFAIAQCITLLCSFFVAAYRDRLQKGQ